MKNKKLVMALAAVCLTVSVSGCGFFLLAGCFDNAIKLQILSILLPFIMGIVNLIVVLTVGRKWSRKTLLNCTLIIKYGPVSYTHLDVYKRQTVS